jgi:hypothetical protein
LQNPSLQKPRLPNPSLPNRLLQKNCDSLLQKLCLPIRLIQTGFAKSAFIKYGFLKFAFIKNRVFLIPLRKSTLTKNRVCPIPPYKIHFSKSHVAKTGYPQFRFLKLGSYYPPLRNPGLPNPPFRNPVFPNCRHPPGFAKFGFGSFCLSHPGFGKSNFSKSDVPNPIYAGFLHAWLDPFGCRAHQTYLMVAVAMPTSLYTFINLFSSTLFKHLNFHVYVMHKIILRICKNRKSHELFKSKLMDCTSHYRFYVVIYPMVC